MTKYSNGAVAASYNARNIDKWIALGLMQRVEQVNSIAEMLSATMEDLFDQVAELESTLDALSDETETIQEKIDEISDLIQEEAGKSLNASKAAACSPDDDLPF